MNKKSFFVASLSAVVHQAYAVNSQVSSQVSAAATQTPSESLISIYENCQISIDDLIGTTATLGNQLQLSPSFNFSGIDENCPDMTATVWLEPPSTCNSNSACPNDGLSVTIESADIVNGAWSHDFQTIAVNGEWFVHVTVTPSSFDCAMAITDGCAPVDVDKPCTAQMSDFVAANSINTAMGDANTYYGAKGISHTMNWAVSDLWNCNLCATYTATSEGQTWTYDVNMNRDDLTNFSDAANSALQFFGDSSYSPFTYTVDIKQCDSGETFTSQTLNIPSPHPACNVTGEFQITDIQPGPSDDEPLKIEQYFNPEPSYTCKDSEFKNILHNDDYQIEMDISVFEDGYYKTLPSPYTELVWDNFPVHVNSSLRLHSRLINATDEDFEFLNSFHAHEQYWPDCEYDVQDPTLDFEIVNGTDFSNHQLVLNTAVQGAYSRYCPPMQGEVTFMRNGEKLMSMALSQSETQSMYIDDPANTGEPVQKSQKLDFQDGKFCAQFQLTPSKAKPNQTPKTAQSQLVCKDVSAYPCQVSPEVAFDGVLNNDNRMMAYSASASYWMNDWCEPNKFEYKWTYDYMDQDWKEVVIEGVDIPSALDTEQYVMEDWTEQESDYQLQTMFQILYYPQKYHSQDMDDNNWVSADYFSHLLTCRPKLAYEPSINEIKEAADGTLTIYLDWMTNTTGWENCNDMVALFNIFKIVDGEEEQVMQIEHDTSFIAPYQAEQQPPMALPGVPLVGACYMVQLIYSQKGHQATQVQQTSDATCYYPLCELSDAAIKLVSNNVDESGDTVQWTFDTSVLANPYCEYINHQVCVSDDASGATWCNQPDSSSKTATVVVTQHGDFGNADFTGKVDVTSSNGTHVSASTPVTLEIQPEWCHFNYKTSIDFWKDKLNKVWINQTAEGSANNVCGEPLLKFQYNNDEEATDWLDSLTHAWTLPSVTGTYSFTTFFQFGNFPSYIFNDNGLIGTWRQGCRVSVTNVDIVEFIAADNASDTQASATLFANGTANGDCGNGVDIYAYLINNDDGTRYTIDIDHAQFFSDGGFTTTQNIGHGANFYTYKVKINATEGESEEHHEARTVSDGYNNQLVNSRKGNGTSEQPVCNVYFNDIQFEGYEEETDYSGPVLATYSGQISYEESCGDVWTTQQVLSSETKDILEFTNVTYTPVGELTDNFTATLQIPNEAGYYYGKGKAYSSINSANKANLRTPEYLWQPPCYLEIAEFEKTGQADSVDKVMTTINYFVKVNQYGDEACEDSRLHVALLDSNNEISFHKTFSSGDKEKALSAAGFNFSVFVPTANAESATMHWRAPDAVKNKTQEAAAYITDNDINCQMQVVDFCLDKAWAINSTTWAFEFNIRMVTNRQCGNVNAWMNIIWDEHHYVGGASVETATINEAFDCDSDKRVTIEVDFDGTPGDVYGQLNLRNNQHQLYLITDSCELSVP